MSSLGRTGLQQAVTACVRPKPAQQSWLSINKWSAQLKPLIIGQATTRRSFVGGPETGAARLPASPKSATTGLRLEGTCKWTEPSKRGETPRTVGLFLPGSLQAVFWKAAGGVGVVGYSLAQGNRDFTSGSQLPHLRKGIPSSWDNYETNVARCNLKALCSWLSTACRYMLSQKARGEMCSELQRPKSGNNTEVFPAGVHPSQLYLNHYTNKPLQ